MQYKIVTHRSILNIKGWQIWIVLFFYLCSSYESIHKFDTNLPKNSCLLRQNARYEYHPVFYLQNILLLAQYVFVQLFYYMTRGLQGDAITQHASHIRKKYLPICFNLNSFRGYNINLTFRCSFKVTSNTNKATPYRWCVSIYNGQFKEEIIT